MTLKPFRSTAFRLNTKALGETTVSTVIDVSVGRVAAATLGVAKAGGVRSSLGYPGVSSTAILPGGADQGRTALVVMNPGLERPSLEGTLSDEGTSQPVAALADTTPAAESARSVPVTTEGPSTIWVTAQDGETAVGRRTFGVASDQASTVGASAPATAWIVLPTVAGTPNHPGIVLTNPGDVSSSVTLSVLPATGGTAVPPEPVTVEVPPGRTVTAPGAFAEAAPRGAVLVVASEGTVVAAGASYSLGREGYATYAVALGVPIPDAWIPGS